MGLFGIFDPFFDALNNGRFIRTVVAAVLRISAVLSAVFGGVIVVILLGNSFRSTAVGPVIAYLLVALLYLVGIFCQLGITLYRARSIANLPDSPYTVMPVVSLLFRWLGESGLAGLSLLGVGGCLFIWFAERALLSEFGMLGALMPGLSGGAGFLGGISFLLILLVLAFAWIVGFYYVADWISLFVEGAGDVSALRRAFVRTRPRAAEKPKAPVAEAVSQPAPRSTLPPDPADEVRQRLAAAAEVVAAARRGAEHLKSVGRWSPELAESAAKMETYLDGASANLDRGDLAAAKHFADWAEYEASRIQASSN